MSRWYRRFLLLLIIAILVSGCAVDLPSSAAPDSQTVLPSGTGQPSARDFNFVFKWGVYEPVNALDTFSETFTQDMVIEPPITITLPLYEDELDRVHAKMVEIGFFDYPEDFRDRSSAPTYRGTVFPPINYYFKVQDGMRIKEVRWPYWNDSSFSDGQAKDLISLMQLIWEILISKEEYKEMPKPKSSYI